MPAFIFTGLLVLAGVAAAASGGGTDILTHAAFGPVFGPHISFGGGAAATAYAYKRGLLETGRDISIPLMGLNRTDVLLVGGAFGLIGYLLNALWQAVGLGPKTDTIALTVVVSAMIARLAFGNSTLIARALPRTKHSIGCAIRKGRRKPPPSASAWACCRPIWPAFSASSAAAAFWVSASPLRPSSSPSSV